MPQKMACSCRDSGSGILHIEEGNWLTAESDHQPPNPTTNRRIRPPTRRPEIFRIFSIAELFEVQLDGLKKIAEGA